MRFFVPNLEETQEEAKVDEKMEDEQKNEAGEGEEKEKEEENEITPAK